MSKKRQYPNIVRTRLAESDLLRFRRCATVRGAQEAALVRDAIQFYLHNFEQGNVTLTESVYATQLKATTNRICGMLAKIAMDARAIYFFVGEDDPEAIRRCREEAGQQINRALTHTEAAISKKIAEHVTPDVG